MVSSILAKHRGSGRERKKPVYGTAVTPGLPVAQMDALCEAPGQRSSKKGLVSSDYWDPNNPSAGCRTITVRQPWTAQWQTNIGQRTHISTMDARTMSFLYPFSNWRFVDQNDGGWDNGTFIDPYQDLTNALQNTPGGGTLWILNPDHYSAVGVLSEPLTLRAGHGVVTLGN